MNIVGAGLLSKFSDAKHFTAKMVFNASSAIVFPVHEEHRNQRIPGVSYEDDYKGNALAAMLAPGNIEIRYHRDFSDDRLKATLTKLLAQPELKVLQSWTITYQGRVL